MTDLEALIGIAILIIVLASVASGIRWLFRSRVRGPEPMSELHADWEQK